MRNLHIAAAVAALLLGLSQASHAQTATTASGATAGAGAQAIAGGTTINTGSANGGGFGANGVGYLNTTTSGTVWTLGGTPSVNTTQYDACTKYISGSAILAGLSVPLEVDMCWKMRQADAIAKYPPGSVQYNLLCADSDIRRNDWDTGQMACTANKAALRKIKPNDPRGVDVTAIPVVAVGGYAVGSNLNPVPNAPPATVVPVPVAPVNQSMAEPLPGRENLPRCKGMNDQSRCYGG